MLLVIDNYDSFTFNIVQYLQMLGCEVDVVRNDEIKVEEIAARHPDKLLISPGPCDPAHAGISMDAIAHYAGKIPIFGVCLGHQSMGQVFGGRVIAAKEIVHGKTSPIYHTGSGVFAGLPSPFLATRYHSLAVERSTLPKMFTVTAWTEDGEIMGIQHTSLPLHGVQFHPESILTEHGMEILRNFIKA